jgi:ATP-dependent Clp protease ATP-binding subunit ClpC
MTEDLAGFGRDARGALARAEAEARDLGHDHIGTEHLLLGLVATTGSSTAAVLDDLGASLAAARHKVAEAVGRSGAMGAPPEGPLPLTARASRSLSRSRRFAHDRHADEISDGHLLLGVLDVEGNAGQVLRGLGVDIDRLRSSIDAPAGDRGSPDTEAAPPAPAASCFSCGAELVDNLAYAIVAAGNSELGPFDTLVFSCGACGVALGILPASKRGE